MTEDEVRRSLRNKMNYAGGLRPLARKYKVSAPYLWQVLHKMKPLGPKILKGMNVKAIKVTFYHKIEKRLRKAARGIMPGDGTKQA